MRDLDIPIDKAKEDALDKYDELSNDIIKDIDIDKPEFDLLKQDDTGKSLFKEMDTTTQSEFARLDKDDQKEIIEGIRDGRMSLQEAKQLIDKKK